MSLNQWLISVAGVLVVGVAIAQQPIPVPTQQTTVATAPASTRRLKIDINISTPQDLKVKEGDSVEAGQILADKDIERKRLTAQREQIKLSLERIKGEFIPKPPAPQPVPPLSELPSISYAQEEASIKAAELALQQAQRNYELNASADPFIREIASRDMVRAKLDQSNRAVELQQRKLDAINSLKDLPPEIIAHETEKLKQKFSELEQSQADLNQKSAELENAKLLRSGNLKALSDAVAIAQANLALAQSRLVEARDKRARDEYEHQITSARRIEEMNQAQLTYSRQQQEYSQTARDKEFQLAQLTNQMAQVEDKLSTIAAIRSPYSGTIKRIKQQKQTDNSLSVELTLIRAGSDRTIPRIAPSSRGGANGTSRGRTGGTAKN